MPDRTGLRDRLLATPSVPSRPYPREPTRTCVGCRQTDSWSALLRVVAVRGEETGTVTLTPDPGRRLPGRGAWLHPSAVCFERTVRRRAFTRALRLQDRLDVGPVAAHLDLHPQSHHPHDQPKAGQTLMSTR